MASDRADIVSDGLSDTAHVVAPPPLLYAGFLTSGFLLSAAVPMPIARGSGVPVLRAAGALLTALGIVLSGAVVRTFKRIGTPVATRKRTTALAVSGPYRLSRNPDYLGQAFVYGGIALVVNVLWPLVLFPAAIAVVQWGVIAREERYLERKFGAEYERYRARVRRWI